MYFLVLASAIIIRIFSNSLANVFQKKLTMNCCQPLVINTLTYSILSVFCIPFILLNFPTNLSENFWMNSVIVGILGSFGNGFLIKALEKGDLSVLGPINAYKAVIGLIFGIFLLKEFPNFVSLSGMFLIIVGSYFVLDTLEERFSFALLKNKQIQYRFLALFFSATEAIFIKKVILASSVFLSFFSWCVFGALFSFILSKILGTNFSKSLVCTNKLEIPKLLFLTSFCIGLSQYATNFVFEKMNVAYSLSLFQLSSILSVFLGYKIFKEKNIKKKLAGTTIMIIGACLIILYN